jgi:beta-glucosidase-like glycosyl hydrolase
MGQQPCECDIQVSLNDLLYEKFKITNTKQSGQVPQSRLDDMVKRILASWYFVGQDSGYPQVTGWSSWNGGVGGPNVQSDHKNVARAIARDGIVLLKNANNALPLKKPASLAIIGQDAVVNPSGANSCPDRACDTGTLAMVSLIVERYCSEKDTNKNDRGGDQGQLTSQ